MNITFVIGNGFDLALGMKCRYGDYIRINRQDTGDIPRKEYERRMSRDSTEFIRSWAEFELAIGKRSTKFNAEKTYMKYVQDFAEGLAEYLRDEVASMDFQGGDNRHRIALVMQNALQYFVSKRRLGNDVCLKLIENDKSKQIDCHFLCFNYTPTLQICLDMIPGQFEAMNKTYQLHRVQHVHGRIDAGLNCRQEAVIMGVDNEQQIANDEFCSYGPLCEQIIKPNRIPPEKREEYCRTIRESDLICIFGMSLGESDSFWWREIGRWLKGKPERQLVIYWFDDRLSAKPPHSAHLQKVADNCRYRFISASRELGWKQDDKKRIHIAINSDLLDCPIPRKEGR